MKPQQQLPVDGPSISAISFESANGTTRTLLRPEQRRQLLGIATEAQLSPRTMVYRESSPLSHLYVVADGVLKSFRDFPSGRRRVMAFLFPQDIFGLAEDGRYVNNVQSITGARIYQLPVDKLLGLMKRDPDLHFQIICKVVHELRVAQRRAIMVGRHDAIGRMAMFLSMLERIEANQTRHGFILIPMARTDIAEYLGLSPEAVSRACSALTRRGLLKFIDRHAASVTDRPGFDQLVRSM
jgi:CRP-like cAMP-binding protein